jgi:hypothetical protein
MGKSRDIYRVLVGNLREREGSIILKWVFRKWDTRAGTGLIWLKIGTSGGLLSLR